MERSSRSLPLARKMVLASSIFQFSESKQERFRRWQLGLGRGSWLGGADRNQVQTLLIFSYVCEQVRFQQGLWKELQKKRAAQFCKNSKYSHEV